MVLKIVGESMDFKVGKPRNRNPFKLIVWIFVSLFLFLIAIMGIRMVQSSIDQVLQPDTDAAHYLSCRCDHWVEDDPYRLFPSKAVMQGSLECSYLHKHNRSSTFFFNDEIVTALKCTYSKDQYQDEVKRLNSICQSEKDIDGNTIYVWKANAGEGVTAYARLNPEKNEVWYVAYQDNMLIEHWSELKLKTDRFLPPE